MVEWFLARWGGRIQKTRRNNPRWKDSFQWVLTARQAHNFLKEIYPYLVIKKENADLVFILHTQSFKGSRSLAESELTHRRLVHDKIRLLNTKGPAAA